ncbi:MAG: 23S rRNA (uracil(1939)-C(5))-methyltransferase RlmD, partial [Nanoarchaeota archaeon]
CGGCSAQDVEYEKQVEGKRAKVSSLLGFDDVKICSGEPFGYRNRMDFIFHQGGIGLRRKGNWRDVVDVDHCPISDPRINALLAEVRPLAKRVSTFNPQQRRGVFRYAVIRTTSRSSTISLVINSDEQRDALGQVTDFARSSSADNVIIARVPSNTDTGLSEDFQVVKGSPYLDEMIAGRRFVFHSQAFFQNNASMAQRLVSYVVDALRDCGANTLLDLYSGVGVFGVSAKDLFEKVVLVESHPLSVECARLNAADLPNVEVVGLDAADSHKVKAEGIIAAIVDPPRSGMHPKAIARLLQRRPKEVVYVSCNPSRIALELQSFVRAGYSIASVAAFDLFPQTEHIEAVVHLRQD